MLSTKQHSALQIWKKTYTIHKQLSFLSIVSCLELNISIPFWKINLLICKRVMNRFLNK